MLLAALTKSNKTVFSLKDLLKILDIKNLNYLHLTVHRMYKRGELFRICQGMYSLNQNYSHLELANKLKTPSYISLETILSEEGIIFQDYSKTISSISNHTFEKEVDGYTYSYSKIKDPILKNPLGIVVTNGVTKATKERAICDRLYLTPNYYFDNLSKVDCNKLLQIASIYNKRVYKEVRTLC